MKLYLNVTFMNAYINRIYTYIDNESNADTVGNNFRVQVFIWRISVKVPFLDSFADLLEILSESIDNLPGSGVEDVLHLKVSDTLGAFSTEDLGDDHNV